MVKGLEVKEVQIIFANRFTGKRKEWMELKQSFIDSGLEVLIKEKVDPLTFQVVYYQITKIRDEEIFSHLIDELS